MNDLEKLKNHFEGFKNQEFINSESVQSRIDAFKRFCQKGIPSLNGYGNGDLLVHVNVWTPQSLSKEQKQFFESMRSDEHFVPDPKKGEKSFFDKVKDMFS